jgi:hypothetical protein
MPAVGNAGGTAKHTVMAAVAPRVPAPAPAPASGKQKRGTLAPAANQSVLPSTGKQPTAQPANPPAGALLPALGSGKLSAVQGTGKMPAVASSKHAAAVALATPPTVKRKGRTAPGAGAASPLLVSGAEPMPRPWINLRGPEISSLGKFGLGLAGVETCWGIFLLMLAGVEVVLRGQAQKPYFTMALIWLVLIAIICALGGQALARPILRRGRIGRMRRGFQAFGLVVYALVLHAVGLWGLVVFGATRPDSLAAVVAFVLFAVNVFVAGALALANTLG